MSLEVTARVVKVGDTSATVEVDWAIICKGASSAFQYFGDLYLIDQNSGERIYMGGLSGPSGKDIQPVALRASGRRLKPYLKASCGGYPDLHGSGTAELLGNEVVLPGRGGGGGGGGGGGTTPPKKPVPPKTQPRKPTSPKKPCDEGKAPPAEKPGTKLQLSQRGLEQIKVEEGWVPRLYNDQAGHCTIGYGHLVHRGRCDGSEPADFRDGITKPEGEELLRRDAREFVDLVNDGVKVPLNQNQFDALVDFAFNVGQGGKKSGFLGSTMLKVLNCGVYGQVPRELLRWIYAHTKDGQRIEVKALVKRRGREATTFVSGEGLEPSTG